MHSPLFTPFALGSLTLRNRVVMSPMTRCRATFNVPKGTTMRASGTGYGCGPAESVYIVDSSEIAAALAGAERAGC